MACQEAMWLRNLMAEMKHAMTGIPLETLVDNTDPDRNPRAANVHFPFAPTTILGDNLGSIETAKQPISSKKSRHIEIRFLKVRESRYQPEAQNRLRVRHIDGDANTADMFTKILPDPLFKSYLKTIGMRISKEQWDATCDPSAKPSAKKRSLREL